MIALIFRRDLSDNFSYPLLPLLAFVLLIFTGCNSNNLSDLNGTLLDPAMEIPDYALQSDQGDIKLSNFHGKYVILAFGYTFCPDACPTTMARLAQAVKLIEADAEDVQVVLISVDPVRDTLEKLKSYTSTFNPDFQGATVAAQDSVSFFKTLGIYHEKAEVASDVDYLVDHTTSTVVLDRAGRWRLVWNFELKPEEMASDLRKLIRTK